MEQKSKKKLSSRIYKKYVDTRHFLSVSCLQLLIRMESFSLIKRDSLLEADIYL